MSVRAFAREMKRRAGMMVRVARVRRHNPLTKLWELDKVPHKLNATGFIQDENGRIQLTRQANPSVGKRGAR